MHVYPIISVLPEVEAAGSEVQSPRLCCEFQASWATGAPPYTNKKQQKNEDNVGPLAPMIVFLWVTMSESAERGR